LQQLNKLIESAVTHAQQNQWFWPQSHNSPKTPGQISKKYNKAGIFFSYVSWRGRS